jgi:hypothetical protein
MSQIACNDIAILGIYAADRQAVSVVGIDAIAGVGGGGPPPQLRAGL